MTEGSIYQNTANTIANGYLQQLMDMQYSKLSNDVVDTLTDVEATGLIAGAEDALSVSPAASNPEIGNVNTDINNLRLIDIHNTPDDTGDDMQLNIVLYVDNISDASIGVGSAQNIVMRYSYTISSTLGTRTATDVLYAIRSKVPNF